MKKRGFTLSEVLITLTVIGVIAAMMIPSLMSSVNEKAWDTGRKALRVRLATALSGLNTIASYGRYETVTDTSGNTTINDNAAEVFLTNGLSKALKIRTICVNDDFKPCHIPEQITVKSGSTIAVPKKLSAIGVNVQEPLKDTKAAAFETVNGESVVVYYNPYCTSELKDTASSFQLEKVMCANFIYDLNGLNGPNQIGKDMGIITAFYAVFPEVVAPVWMDTVTGVSFDDTNTGKDIGTKCMQSDPDTVPATIEEASALYINRILTGANIERQAGGATWTSSVRSSGKNGLAWWLYSWTDNKAAAVLATRSASAKAFCIRQ